MPNQLRVAKVDSDGLWLVDRNGVELAWGEMSDGYRAMLALLADIIHHLINAYGISGLTAVDSDGRTYINRKGHQLECFWHGKIKSPQYRIHFSYPIEEDVPLYIAYIGPKLTKR